MTDDAAARLRIDVGTAVRPIAGESEAGDAAVTVRSTDRVVVALADGLGHGPRAAVASQAFLKIVERDAALPLDRLFFNAHRALLPTRGAVASVVRIDEARGSVEAGAIGNVAVAIVRPSRITRILSTPAIVGGSYRTVRAEAHDIEPGDVIVLHTDGVHSRFDFTTIRDMDAQAAAEHVIASAGKTSDDAGCVVLQAFALTRVRSLAPPAPGEVAPRTVPIRIRGDAECVSNETRRFAELIGLPVRAQWEAAIVSSELATNVLKFANKGTATLTHVKAPREALVIEIIDEGNGIRDVNAAIVDGYSDNRMLTPDRPRTAGQGLGVGLGTVHRLSDEVRIESTPQQGTRITVWKYRR